MIRIKMRKNKIIVVGVFVVDLSFKSSKIPKLGETVICDSYNIGPGGKGSNQCVAIARAGGDVSLIARIGDDQFGKMAKKIYENTGVDSSQVIISKKYATGAAGILVNQQGQNAINVVTGAGGTLKEEDVDNAISIIKKLLAGKCFRTTNDLKNLTGNGSLSCLVVF